MKKKDEAKAAGGVSLTDQIDRLAFRYLAPPLLLLVVTYASYCLVYSYFKGWYALDPRVPTHHGSTNYGPTHYGSTHHGSTDYRYSWILECLVALVYGGGFIVMTPQALATYYPLTDHHLLPTQCIPTLYWLLTTYRIVMTLQLFINCKLCLLCLLY